MSFWNLSEGEHSTDGTMEMGGGSDPIPEGTQVKAAMDEIKWGIYEGDEFVSARWTVLDGDYKNRKVFQKIRVKDADSKKRDKALRMLAAIDKNAGGQLMKLGKEPDDMQLAGALLNKPMALKLSVWEMNDRKGNWVQAVSPLNYKQPKTEAPKADPDAFDDDIPF